jgi:plasmid stabilization system protein ParE
MSDVEGIRAYHGPNAPGTVETFIRKLKASGAKLRDFPEFGSIVPELEGTGCRELQYGNYRIVYRYSAGTVIIQTVWRASRPLRREGLSEL